MERIWGREAPERGWGRRCVKKEMGGRADVELSTHLSAEGREIFGDFIRGDPCKIRAEGARNFWEWVRYSENPPPS